MEPPCFPHNLRMPHRKKKLAWKNNKRKIKNNIHCHKAVTTLKIITIYIGKDYKVYGSYIL